MKALQFDRFGSADVVALRDVPKPEPGLPPLPRGLGLEIAGTVDGLGEGVAGVAVGDRVFGPATYDGSTAGAAEYGVMKAWAPIPASLSAEQAAALPMAAETAWQALDDLGVQPGELLLVHGAGSTVGEAAVRLAIHRGVRVIATAGPTRAAALKEIGAQVTTYGDGMAERVAALAGGSVDRALDASPTGGRIDRADKASPAGGSLPALIELTGNPDRVVTVSDFAAAADLGTRTTQIQMRYDLLREFARLAGEGVLVVSVARTYPLGQIHEAAQLSQSRRPGGKLVLVP